MRKYILVLGALAASLTFASPAFATFGGVEALKLDSYQVPNTGSTGPATTTKPLQKKKKYAVLVRGTYSAYLANLWSGSGLPRQVPCGTPESAPQRPSPAGQMTGPVGQDAETIFAAVELYSCENSYPRKHAGFQVNLGAGYVDPAPIDGTQGLAKYHLYPYLFTGTGVPASFRLVDSNTADNYGVFDIVVVPISKSLCKFRGLQAMGVSKGGEAKMCK